MKRTTIHGYTHNGYETGQQIKKRGLITEFNSNKNTALILAKIFGLSKLPELWKGAIPKGVFK